MDELEAFYRQLVAELHRPVPAYVWPEPELAPAESGLALIFELAPIRAPKRPHLTAVADGAYRTGESQ